MSLQSTTHRFLANLAGRRLFTTTARPLMLTPTLTLTARFREDLKPYGGSEETQSGTNAEIAADDRSYDPSDNNPQAEMNSAQQQKDGNPLQYSGANPAVSDTKERRSGREGGATQERPSALKQKKVTRDPDSGENRGVYTGGRKD